MFARKLEDLKRTADVITSARLLAISSKESGAWLTALLVAAFGNLLDDTSFRVAVALRLGRGGMRQPYLRMRRER